MQLFNNELRGPALTLALVTLLSLADAQRQGPISYLSVTPNLTILYSWEPKCITNNNCLSSILAPGACYNLKSAAPGGTPELFNNFNSWYGMGNPLPPGGGTAVSLFTCQVYASPECLTSIATYSWDAPTVASEVATRAASIRCGTWYFDPTMNTDYMLVIGKFRYCNNNWLGGSCLTVYPYLSRCYDFTRSSGQVVSVMASQGMYCYLYSASGCAGNMVGIPIGWLMNVADLGFTGMAKSFMCIGGI